MQPIDVKRDDAEPLAVLAGQNVQAWHSRQAIPKQFQKLPPAATDIFLTHGLFQPKAKRGPDCLDEAGRAAVFAGLDIVKIFVTAPRVGPLDGTPTGVIG